MAAGELIADRYELEELVGSGGMSDVYRARDRMLERTVALKVLDARAADDEAIERFRREARAVAQLSHPNVVTVIDRGQDGDRQYIVFEYVPGETLKELLERTGRLAIRRALELALEVGRGLAYAHANGIVHRDVKPQNVLLNGDGQPKVTDFGIARSLDVDGVTETGTVIGTSNYIAPEQASGRPVDAQTDVYSLGVVLFELLTGRVPFEGESFVAVALQHINEAPPSVLELRPDVPLRVANAVERALAKDPAQRFPTMEAFVAELEECLAQLDAEPAENPTQIVPVPLTLEARVRPHRARRRRVWPWVVGGAVAVGTVAVAVAALRDGGADSAQATTASIELRAVASYDPFGDGAEHPERVAEATDGDPASYWPTETYYSDFEKDGVGLVVDAGRTADPSQFIVRTSTPGFTAEIRSGSSRSGPFELRVSESQQVRTVTTFAIDGDAARYYVLWITDLHGVARVNEVQARD